MKINFYRSPDPAPVSPPPIIHHTPRFPRKDDDVSDVAQTLKTKWASVPAITLLWITQAQFATLANNFKNELATRKTTGTARSPITDQLDTLDNDIDNGTREVKTYIANKFGAIHATANYAPFGIVHEHHHYQLPVDHDRRSANLQLMIDAIAANGFGTNTYGTTFWTGTKTQFDTLLGQANTTDGTVSSQVSTKNQMKVQIYAVFAAIWLVLEANYPQTFAGERRDWGFQKEDY